jgi:2,3-bisphosphoglycerate-dependent phosphoglycerate mutase
MSTTVVLVRHGESVCNVSGVIGGLKTCTGLTGTGRRQVEALAARLARTAELGPVAALYSSSLPRAVDTAEILAPALLPWPPGGPTLTVRRDCGLCEVHPGVADGLRFAELTEQFGEPDWDNDPAAPIAPGGESWLGFVERASDAVIALANAHQGTTVVVATHGGVVEATMLRLLGVPAGRSRLELLTAHASLTVWVRDGQRWTLERYNDRAHLAAAG